MQNPLLPPLIAMMAGIAAGYYIHPLPLTLLTGGTIVIALIVISGCRKKPAPIMPLALTAMFILGTANSLFSYHRFGDAAQIFQYAETGKIHIEGMIDGSPEETPAGFVFTLSAREVLKEGHYLPAEGRIVIHSAPLPLSLHYGDYVRLRTRLTKPRNFQNPGSYNYERQLRGRGILLQGRLDSAADLILLREGQGNLLRRKLEKLRGTLHEIIANNSSTPQKEILLALLLGEKKVIPPLLRENFNRTGTSHILAISGLHVGIVSSFAVFSALFFMKLSSRLLLKFNVLNMASLFALMPIVAYAFIAGLGVSVLRATAMIAAFIAALLLRKESSLLNSLALAAYVILLFSPAALFDISFQLSFAAAASLITAVPLIQNVYPFNFGGNKGSPSSPLQRTARYLLIFILVSLVAALGTMPLIAYYFNSLSTVSLPANLLVVPLLAMLALPTGMGAIVALFISPYPAAILIKAASFFIKAALLLINCLASLPAASLSVTTPTLPEIAGYYLLWGIALKGLELKTNNGKNNNANPLLRPAVLKVSFLLIALFFIADISYRHLREVFRTDLRVTAIDVGQGSSILLRLPAGKNVLIDGGGFAYGDFDVGRYVVSPFLRHERIGAFEAVVATHPHPDHIQGLIYIIKSFPVREVWSNGRGADNELYRQFLGIIAEKHIRHRVLHEGSAPLSISGVTFKTLNPSSPFRTVEGIKAGNLQDEENNASLVLKITYGKISLLIPGDITAPAEMELIRSGKELKSDVIFAPHHGGAASSTLPFLQMTQPRAAVISCGYKNVFGLPHPLVLQRYAALGTKIFRTDLHGAVTVITDGVNLRMETALSP